MESMIDEKIRKHTIQKRHMISNSNSILKENGVSTDISIKISERLWNQVYFILMSNMMLPVRRQMWVKMDNDEIL